MHLSKHHGLGNDFLVILDEANERPVAVDGELARRLCDRRRSIGADGLIHGTRAGPDHDAGLAMALFNADGSRAEMSGNGIRCLGQAVATEREEHELVLDIATDGGTRRVVVDSGPDFQTSVVTVEMGQPLPGPAPSQAVRDRVSGRLATADLGNPHLVVESPSSEALEAVDLEQEGPWLEAQFPHGVNVEWVTVVPDEPDVLALRVWERGVGVTEACGTGATAAAHLAHHWGLVGDDVEVRMPGGAAQVLLGPHGARLVGPAHHIATIEIPDG